MPVNRSLPRAIHRRNETVSALATIANLCQYFAPFLAQNIGEEHGGETLSRAVTKLTSHQRSVMTFVPQATLAIISHASINKALFYLWTRGKLSTTTRAA